MNCPLPFSTEYLEIVYRKQTGNRLTSVPILGLLQEASISRRVSAQPVCFVNTCAAFPPSATTVLPQLVA